MKCAKSAWEKSANAVTIMPGRPARAGKIRSRQRQAAPVTLGGRRHRAAVMPHAKPTEEREVIAAQARVLRQPLQLARIAAADDDVVGLQDGAQFRHDLDHGSTPLLGAETFEGALTDPFLVTAFRTSFACVLSRCP